MNIPIAVCVTKIKPHFEVFLKSVEKYVPNAEIYLCSNERYDSKLIKQIIPNTGKNAGESFNLILNSVFEKYNKAILVNDDVVLTPDCFKLITEDWFSLKKDNVGMLGARSDYCLPSYNIRFPAANDFIKNLRWNSEYSVKPVEVIGPAFLLIDREAFQKTKGFPPTNWYSDNIICSEMLNHGYKLFASRAYVHHVGEQTNTENYEQMHKDAINNLKGTYWEKYVQIFDNPQQSAPVQSNQNRQRRVMLGTPSHDGKVEVVYLHSVINTIKLCAQNGIEVLPFHICYESLLQISRNDIFKTAYMSQIDDLIFVDSDQEWQPEQFLRLLMHPVDFAGCPVVKKGDAESYNIKCLKWPIPRDKNTGLLEVDSIGTGFMRLSRRAIEKMWNMSEKYDSEKDKDNRNVFETKIVDGSFYSEDVYFCKKWLDSGEKIYLDDEMTCSHVGTKKWNGNFNLWLKTLKK